MTLRDKLKLIQKYSGLTQAELALSLEVTFVALNRWINGKATPRVKAQEKIDTLYKEYSGEKQIPDTLLEAKKEIVSKKSQKYKNVLKEILNNTDILDQFYLSLTYNSNKIEGSTLTEGDTAAIMFKNVALPNKSITEQLEVKNHRTALEYLFLHLIKKNPINEELILKLHSILMNSIHSDAGIYRNHGVRIVGTYVPTANYLKVPKLMKELVENIKKKNTDTIDHIADIHSRFEQIHPFGDGNGRIGRLIMHAMALKSNLAPVVILQEKRILYTTYLNKAQMKNDKTLLQDFVCDAILEGYKILDRG